MNRTIYQTAIKSLKRQREFESKLDGIGLKFEYGEGLFGTFCDNVFNDCELIIRESLGLHIEHESGCYSIDGVKHPISFEVLYRNDHDIDFSITMDDFLEFVSEIVYKVDTDVEIISDLIWKALVEKDTAAKEQYNKIKKRCVIGVTRTE